MSLGTDDERKAFAEMWHKIAERHWSGHPPSPDGDTWAVQMAREVYAEGIQRGQELRGCCKVEPPG